MAGNGLVTKSLPTIDGPQYKASGYLVLPGFRHRKINIDVTCQHRNRTPDIWNNAVLVPPQQGFSSYVALLSFLNDHNKAGNG